MAPKKKDSNKNKGYFAEKRPVEGEPWKPAAHVNSKRQPSKPDLPGPGSDEKRKIAGQQSFDPHAVKYHYTKEERERFHSARDEKRSKQGMFRRNPTLFIILFDVVFIFLIIFAIVPFIRSREESPARLHDYTFSLSAFYFDQSLYITLQVKADENDSDRAEHPDTGEQELIFVTFSIKGTEKNEQVPDLLPLPGKIREIRAQMSGDQNNIILAEIIIDGQQLILEKKVTK